MSEEPNRTEKILAQLLILALKDAALGEKASVLSQAGFEPSEIASLVGATPGSVRQQLYAHRKAAGTKKKAPKK